MNNINVNYIQPNPINSDFNLDIETIKDCLEKAKNTLVPSFFLSDYSFQQKKDNIQKILNFIESNDNCIPSITDNTEIVSDIFKHINFIKSPENLPQNQTSLKELNQLIQTYLGFHRAKQPFKYFYKITNTATRSLEAYNNNYKTVILEKLKVSIKLKNDGLICIENFNRLYKEYKHILGDINCKKLFRELFDNYSNYSTPYRLSNVIKLLDNSKALFPKIVNSKFYKQKVLEVFKNINDHRILGIFLNKYGHFIDNNVADIIIDKYQTTDCINIAYKICQHVVNSEIYINLPPRSIFYNNSYHDLGNNHIYIINQLFNNKNYNKMIESDIKHVLENKNNASPLISS